MKAYYKSLKGKRQTNEDNHTIIEGAPPYNINMYCVYDGHGGGNVSRLLSNIVPKLFINEKITYPLNRGRVKILCDAIQKGMINKIPHIVNECGSTCLMIFHFNYNNSRYINIVNIGDSRAVICNNITAHALTMDHKPLNPIERQRIARAGGKIYNDGYDWRISGLSVSRAFGDTSSPYTSPIPDVILYKICKLDKFIIMACDGLWDVVDNQTAVNFVLHACYNINGARINEKINIAEQLAEYAITQGSQDNVTVIVIFIN